MRKRRSRRRSADAARAIVKCLLEIMSRRPETINLREEGVRSQQNVRERRQGIITPEYSNLREEHEDLSVWFSSHCARVGVKSHRPRNRSCRSCGTQALTSVDAAVGQNMVIKSSSGSCRRRKQPRYVHYVTTNCRWLRTIDCSRGCSIDIHTRSSDGWYGGENSIPFHALSQSSLASGCKRDVELELSVATLIP